MPLVFLHGANVRREDNPNEFDRMVMQRDEFFKLHGLHSLIADPNQVQIYNPYWGNLGATFAWDLGSLPRRGAEQFGPEDELPLLVVSSALAGLPPDGKIDPENILTIAARRSLSEAVDMLWAAGVDGLRRAEDTAAMASLSARAADYALHNPKPPWLRRVRNDRQLVDKLTESISAWRFPGEAPLAAPAAATETFGAEALWDPIRAARARLQQVAQTLSPQSLLDFTRQKITAGVGRLIGDIFTYLAKRGPQNRPGPIVQKAIAELERARDCVNGNDRYVIAIGHSLGGEVLYDTLTYYRPDLNVDLLMTVGSQVGIFAELRLLPGIDPKLPDAASRRVARPANVKHWLNVYDLSDFLGFAASRVFDGVPDYEFSTGQGLLAAHSSYFTTPSFHERLAQRLREVFP